MKTRKTYAPAPITLTDEQRAAILAYAAENGAAWKDRLRADWLRASARVNGEHSAALQQLRNTASPSWLASVTLADLEKNS